jgi:hypothetical protein
MAENYTPNPVATFVNDTTAVNTVNNNFAAISTVFTDVLSRSGVSPNQMTSSLDMNNNQIINLPPPSTANSPARLIDVATPGSITVNTATTGTSGHVVPFLDGANTWSNTQTITGTLASGFNENISVNTTGSNLNWNTMFIGDTANVTGLGSGLNIQLALNSTGVQGIRQALTCTTILNSPTNAANPTKLYSGVVGGSVANGVGDGGTGVTSGTGAGSFFGGDFFFQANTGATNLLTANAGTFTTNMAAGTSIWAKSLAQFFGVTTDAVAGSGINTMLWLYNGGGGSAKWTNGILFDNGGGTGSFPIGSTGTIIKATGGGTVTTAIDMSTINFTGNILSFPSCSLTNLGVLNLGATGVSTGAVVLFGTTSGAIVLNANATATLLSSNQPFQTGAVGVVAGGVTIAGLTSGSATLTCSNTGGILQTANAFATTSTLASGSVGTTSGQLTLNGSTSGSVALTTPNASAGLLQFASAGSFSANAAVATVLGSVGPTGSHTAVQKWLTIVDNTGTTGYIPVF